MWANRRSIRATLAGAWLIYIAIAIYATVQGIRIPLHTLIIAGLIIATTAEIVQRSTRRIDVVATAKYRDGYADGYVDGVARATPRRSLHVVH